MTIHFVFRQLNLAITSRIRYQVWYKIKYHFRAQNSLKFNLKTKIEQTEKAFTQVNVFTTCIRKENLSIYACVKCVLRDVLKF